MLRRFLISTARVEAVSDYGFPAVFRFQDSHLYVTALILFGAKIGNESEQLLPEVLHGHRIDDTRATTITKALPAADSESVEGGRQVVLAHLGRCMSRP